MSREMKLDQKFCINRKSDFSNKMSNLFNKGKTMSFEELWKKAEFRKLMDEEKPNYDIIQFSFVILNNQGNLLFIQRGPAHVITKGTSILQSCSPWMHSPGKPAPSSLDDIRFYFEQEVTDISSDYDIDLLGIVRNVRKRINYYFYIFRVQFHDNQPTLNLKENDSLLGYFNPNSPNSSKALEGLKDNKVDLRVLEALFPTFHVAPSKVGGCILHKDYEHELLGTLFTTQEPEIEVEHIADREKGWIKVRYIANTVKDWVRVCIVQLNFSLDRLPPPDKFAYVLKEKDRIKKKVFGALEIAKQEEVNIICFPELSFAKEWVKKIKDSYHGMIIIGGSYYENEFNTCPTIIDGAVFYIQKANPSPNFENKRGGRGMRRGNENFVFQTEYGKFSVLICFDYRKELSKILDNPDEKIKNVDFIIVPEYNKDIETFQTQADADCRKEHFPYILQVNVGKIKDKEIGGTCIIGTEHEDSLEGYEDDGYKQTEDRIKYKLIEALGEMMVIVDLDIKRKGVPVPASGDKMNPIGCYIYRTDKWIEDKINIWL